MKRSIPLTLFLALIIAVFTASPAWVAAAGMQTRDLVFEDEDVTPPKAPEGTGENFKVSFKVTIELDRNGKKSTVLPSHTFKTGDRVKILYATSIDCYVYWMSEGASGDFYMLFPTAKTGQNNWVEKNKTYTIPPGKGASFKFTEPKGVEKIIVVMAPTRLEELEEAAKEAAVKGGRVSDNASKVASIKEEQAEKRKTRDLVFEEDVDEETGIVTNTQVSKDINEVFSPDPIILRHE